jgi:hypothetical protein
MAFESETERLFKLIEVGRATKGYEYVEYGKDFIRMKKEGGNVFEIRVREKSSIIRRIKIGDSGVIKRVKKEG